MEAQYLPSSKTNSMAIVSLIAGILAWFIALILLCLNLGILPIFTIATMGLGSMLYLCTAAPGCISMIGWLVAIIAGHAAKRQIKQTGDRGGGAATAGLIMGYIGLGLTVIIICLIVILLIAGVPILDQLNSGYGY